MTTAILLVTHGEIGEDLLATASKLMQPLPTAARALAIPFSCNPDEMAVRARQCCDELDTGNGVLILTDLCGATPDNIATRLHQPHKRRVVSGANLPMLLRALNYCRLGVEELAHKAADGGHNGIVERDARGAP